MGYRMEEEFDNDSDLCKHEMAFCEDCAYERGKIDERDRISKVICDLCRTSYKNPQGEVSLPEKDESGDWIHRIAGIMWPCEANRIRKVES